MQFVAFHDEPVSTKYFAAWLVGFFQADKSKDSLALSSPHLYR